MISVIILYYNDRFHIQEAVHSVLNQTILPSQILIVDNGSTDGGLKVFENNSSIEILRLAKNQNLGFARNYGLKKVQTDFVAFLDSDDVWHSTKIERVMPILDNPDIHYIHSNFVRINGDGYRISSGQIAGLEGSCSKQHFRLGPITIGPPSTIIGRTSSIEKVGGFNNELSVSADWDLNQRMARNYSITYSPEILVSYRVHSNNLSRNIELYFSEMKKTLKNIYINFEVNEYDYRYAKSKLNLIMAGELWNQRQPRFVKFLFFSFLLAPRVIFHRLFE